jgi:hypothetical protein
MPIFFAAAPTAVTNSQGSGVGLHADSHTTQPMSVVGHIGYNLYATTWTQWTLTVDTMASGATEFTATVRVGNTDQYDLILPTSDAAAGPTLTALGHTLGRATYATLPNVGVAAPPTGTPFGFHWAQDVGIAHRGRSAIKYVLQDQHWTSALVGGGRVEAVFDKTNTPGVYAVLGTPTAGRMNVNTEALAQVPWPARGNFTGMRVYASSGTAEGFGPSPGFPARFQVRVNNAVTSLTIVVTPGVISYDLTAVHSVSFGDLVTLHAQPFSWAAGSAFHGWCQLTFLPVAADAPFPPVDPTSGFAIAPLGGAPHYWQTGRWRVAGMPTGRLVQECNPNNHSDIFAVPFFVANSTTIVEEMALTVVGNGNGLAKLGIYEAISSRDLYPGPRITQTTSGTNLSLASPGFKSLPVDSVVQLVPNKLYFGVAAVTSWIVDEVKAVDNNNYAMMVGVGSGGEPIFGWGGAYTPFTLPDQFPADIPLFNGNVPAIGYAVQSGVVI